MSYSHCATGVFYAREDLLHCGFIGIDQSSSVKSWSLDEGRVTIWYPLTLSLSVPCAYLYWWLMSAQWLCVVSIHSGFLICEGPRLPSWTASTDKFRCRYISRIQNGLTQRKAIAHSSTTSRDRRMAYSGTKFGLLVYLVLSLTRTDRQWCAK